MEEILLDTTLEHIPFNMQKDAKQLEAFLNKSDDLSGTTDRCPKIISLFQGRGSSKDKEYFQYSTTTLLNLLAVEFNKLSNAETVKGLTEIKIRMLVDKTGELEKLTLIEVYPYEAIQNSGDYGDVQKILNQIHIEFKETEIENQCGKYLMHLTAVWKMLE
jgi:hypothetical protein